MSKCRHDNLRGIYGDEINAVNGKRSECLDCHTLFGELPPKVTGDTGDGYHTFNELYEFRLLYNAAWFNDMAYLYDERGIGPKPVKSKRHSDGELCFGGGWFVVVVQLGTGQISNHYELKDWDLFQIDEVERAPKWDGHSAQDVVERLRAYIKNTSLTS